MSGFIINPYAHGGGGGPPPVDPYPDVIVDDAPIRYLRFEEASGTAIADTMGGADWTLSGTVTQDIAGAVDKAKKFVSGGVARSASAPTAIPFSIEFWIKLFTSDSPANSYLISRVNTFDVIFHFGGANTITVFRNLSPTLASTSLPMVVPRDDAWHHVVITYNGSTIIGYLDGVQENTLSHAGSYTLSTECTIGRSTANTNPFLGGLDEVAFYNYVLSAGQVAAHFAAR